MHNFRGRFLKKFIFAKLTVSHPLQEGRSVLTMAAQCGHNSLLEIVLDSGADSFHIDAVGSVGGHFYQYQ